MKLRAAFALVVFASGCIQVREEERVEPGPLLRSFERESAPKPAGTRVRAEAKWPSLTLAFESFSLCQKESVEERAEDHVTEWTAPGAYPTLASGASATVLGIALLAAQGLFSNAPNTRAIDGGGHYGPSDRQIATGWGIGLLVVGLPAVIAGGIGALRSGERTETRKSEQVVSQRELPCEVRPADGRVELVSAKGPEKTFDTQGGRLVLQDSDLRGFSLSGVLLDGKAVVLPEEEVPTFEQYVACVSVLPEPPPEAIASWELEHVDEALDEARKCASVPLAPVGDLVRHLEAELSRREKEAAKPEPRSFEEAVQRSAPTLRFAPGSPDLARLPHPEELIGQTAVLEGTLVERPEANIAVLAVGGERVLVFIPPGASFGTPFPEGSRLQVLGVVTGRQRLGELEAPLFRAIWMRPAP